MGIFLFVSLVKKLASVMNEKSPGRTDSAGRIFSSNTCSVDTGRGVYH